MPPPPTARTALPAETASASATPVRSYDGLQVEEDGVVNQVQQHGQEQAAAYDARIAEKGTGDNEHRYAQRLPDMRQAEHRRYDPHGAVQADIAPDGVHGQVAKEELFDDRGLNAHENKGQRRERQAQLKRLRCLHILLQEPVIAVVDADQEGQSRPGPQPSD